MTDSPDDFLGFLRPTPERPLLGQTILAVDDSRCAGEALRLLSLHSGARFRRADSLRAAHRHLATYRPTVVICDAGLPDGSGVALVSELAQARPRVSALIGLSGDPEMGDALRAAGADGFIEKPVTSLAAFQAAVLSVLPRDQVPTGPHRVSDTSIQADAEAVTDDLAHVADLLSSAEGEGTTSYIAGLVAGIGRFAGDDQLVDVAERLKLAMRNGRPFAVPLATLSGLVQDRLSARHAAG